MRLSWLMIIAAACNGADPGDTDADADADTDADSDTDTDTDVAATVCDDGVAPFSVLQDAIDAAAAGDEIVVCPGHWARIEWAGKALTLRGVDAATTFISGDPDHPAVLIQSVDGGDLSGFTVKGDGAAEIIGLSADKSTLSIHDMRFSGAVVTSGDGDPVLVDLLGSTIDVDAIEISDNFGVGRLLSVKQGTYTLTHSRIHDNSGGMGIWVVDAVTLDMTNNLVYGNDSGGGGYGLDASYQSPHIRVWNNTWYGNYWQGDAYVREGVDFDDNLTVGARGLAGFTIQTDDGDYNMGWSSIATALDIQRGGDGNVTVDPELADPDHGDFHLSSGSPAIDGGDPYGWEDADGSRVDCGAYGGPDGAW